MSERRKLMTPATSQIVLTVDTEPDDAWTDHRNQSLYNLAALEPLQNMLERYGGRSTLLVTMLVAQDKSAVKQLKSLQARGAEIGAHLHPWETPPFLTTGLDRTYPSFPHELPLELFEEKLANLTARIAEEFGPPVSYRAGRWGMVAEHLPILERFGYRVDSSTVPLESWSDVCGIPSERGGCRGPDYRRVPRHPYHPAYSDLDRIGAAAILEVPVTVGFRRWVPELLRSAYSRSPRSVQRFMRRVLGIRPIWATAARPREDGWSALIADLTPNPGVINVTIHSSELMAGTSPRSITQNTASENLLRIEQIMKLGATIRNCDYATLSELANRYWPRVGNANDN